MYSLRNKFAKELYIYNTKHNLCGIYVNCLHKLDMNKKEDYGYYKECYDSINY
jgi:hypothetical protein